jgi:lipoprotein-releasing system permease protein
MSLKSKSSINSRKGTDKLVYFLVWLFSFFAMIPLFLILWDFFRTNLLEGDIINPDDTTSANQAIISKSIADKLQLKTGDRFTCYFVQEPVRARRFDITGIYETNFEDYDQLFILTEKIILGNLNEWDDDMASGIEVLVKDYDNLDVTAQNLFFEMSSYKDRFGNALYTRSIKDINPMIFNWLELLNMNVWVIIILMLIVSGFTMISGLLIIILERTNMIGILKSIGARDFSIRKVFLYLSAFLIGKGMLWGNIIALVFCIIQHQFNILKLDPSTYYLSAVPVDLNVIYIILLNIGTLLVSLLMMIGPSYLVARITPSKSIMFE